MKHASSCPSHPEPNTGEIFVSEAGVCFFFFWWWLFVSFLTPCQCAKIPAAVELQANVVKANRCVCWRASLDDTGLLQSYLKRVFIIFYGAK